MNNQIYIISFPKVHAIRDLQIKEKNEISTHENEEDKRLDVIMEVHRLNGIKHAERLEKEQQERPIY